MREASRLNTMGLQTTISTRHVGTLLLLTISNKETRIHKCILEHPKLEYRK